ncbi:MAG: hypothetical protein Q4Q07_00005 [Tissierellia bacterium]|nr:hypothetical protein [Tissierellia bacterium]
MKKRALKILLLFLLLFLVGCKEPQTEEEIISDFLDKRAKLQNYQEEFIQAGDRILIDGSLEKNDAKEKDIKELEEILKDLKALMVEREFERYMEKRSFFNEDFIRGVYDYCDIKDISCEEVSAEDNNKVYDVKYQEVLSLEGKIKEERTHNIMITLEKKGRSWKIAYIMNDE